MDLFVVPTISFRLLYGFLILQHSRREIARQLTEACGWQQAPQYIVRDRDCVYSGGRLDHRLDGARLPSKRMLD